ncbi:MAG: hypothetical protein QME59_03990 [Candidatus Hydrothermarchaeota archaeon]|nr:hypothetical protein [Candidatus Hydrothermarchaeota archaeon]
MKINIITEKEDIDKIHELLEKQKSNAIFIERYNSNVKASPPKFSKELFWHVIIGCLLTSRQNVEKGSPVDRFLNRDPFPLTLDLCEKNEVKEYVEKTLTDFRGIRFTKRIGKFADENLRWLNSGGWQKIADESAKLANVRSREPIFEDIEIERQVANFIDKNLKGFGPKQSRNFWQWLGYTRFEIPIDSRVTNWLNSNNIFPWKISTKVLTEVYYYEMVLDWIQNLCKNANVLPCMLDAAIFSIYENE